MSVASAPAPSSPRKRGHIHLELPIMTFFRSAIATLALAASVPAVARAQAAKPAGGQGASDSTAAATKPDSSGNHPDSTAAKAKAAKPGLDFSGLVFGDFQLTTDEASKAANGGKSPNKFDIGRAYLNFRMPAGDRASVRVTTDIKQQDGSNGAYDGWIVRLKYAYLSYDFVKSANPDAFAATARVGLLHTVLIDHEEHFWPRYLNKVPTDAYGYFASSDLGVATQLTFPNRLGEIYATIVNGSGYEHPESDRFKDYAVRLSLTPLGRTEGFLRSFTISPWIYAGKSASRFADDPTTPITDGLQKKRYGVFAGVRDRRLTVGGEWARRIDGVESGSTSLDRSVADNTGDVYSAFAIARPLEWVSGSGPSSVGLLFRWDQVRPNVESSGKLRYLLGGVFWEPTPKTALALDYQRTKPVDGLAGAESENWYLHWQVSF